MKVLNNSMLSMSGRVLSSAASYNKSIIILLVYALLFVYQPRSNKFNGYKIDVRRLNE